MLSTTSVDNCEDNMVATQISLCNSAGFRAWVKLRQALDFFRELSPPSVDKSEDKLGLTSNYP